MENDLMINHQFLGLSQILQTHMATLAMRNKKATSEYQLNWKRLAVFEYLTSHFLVTIIF